MNNQNKQKQPTGWASFTVWSNEQQEYWKHCVAMLSNKKQNYGMALGSLF
jgi:hypothetical protein